MKAVVTGGAGFIGSCIARKLVAEGFDVKIIDNFSTGSMANLAGIKGKIKIVKGDITNPAMLKKELKGADFVFHLAAIASVQSSVRDPLLSSKVNADGTLYVLMAARDNKVKRVVFSSSAAVYGDEPTMPKREDSPVKPLSMYAASKLAGEHYCKVFSELYGLDTVCLRYFNVYGERQNPDSEYAAVIPKFIKLMLKGQQPIIFGDGKQTRDFVYVGDVARANVLAANAEKLDGQVINIATGRSISILELIRKLNYALGTDIKPVFKEAKPGDIKISTADSAMAREILDWVPEKDIKDGLAAISHTQKP